MRERDEDRAHRSSASRDRRARAPARCGKNGTACSCSRLRSGRTRAGPRARARRRPGRTAIPTSGPMTPPAMIPAAGSQASPIAHAQDRAGDRRDELAPARDEARRRGRPSPPGRSRRARIASGSGMLPPIVTPMSVARFHGMNVLTIAPIEVAPDVAPPDATEMGDREGECLVGQHLRHAGADPARPVGRYGASAAA